MQDKKELIKLSFAVIAFGVAVYLTKLFLRGVNIYTYASIGMICFVLIKCGWYSIKTVWKAIFDIPAGTPVPKGKVN